MVTKGKGWQTGMKVKIIAERSVWKDLRCPICGDWLGHDWMFDRPPEKCNNCETEIEFKDSEQE